MALRPACAVVIGLHERRVPHQPGDCMYLGHQGGPGGGKEGGAGKPRGNPGAVGKGAPVVSPAEPKARIF
jgi:hypothetical protein